MYDLFVGFEYKRPHLTLNITNFKMAVPRNFIFAYRHVWFVGRGMFWGLSWPINWRCLFVLFSDIKWVNEISIFVLLQHVNLLISWIISEPYIYVCSINFVKWWPRTSRTRNRCDVDWLHVRHNINNNTCHSRGTAPKIRSVPSTLLLHVKMNYIYRSSQHPGIQIR